MGQPDWDADVFLGGSCGTVGSESTWRTDVAIPLLDRAGISWCNPQLPPGMWDPSMIYAERRAKERCRYLVMVIGCGTRAIASIQEATHYLLRDHNQPLMRKQLFLVVRDVLPGTVINGREIDGKDLDDANRGRAFLRDDVRVMRPDLAVYDTPEDAIRAVVFAEENRRR